MIPYRGGYLAKGSHAYELWEKKNFKALDAHLKELDRKEKDLLERYSRGERKEGHTNSSSSVVETSKGVEEGILEVGASGSTERG